MTSGTVYRTALTGMKLLYAGKVRDNYAVDDQSMLIVTTDRLSVFDVVLPDPVPDKGRVLTQISNFWFDRTRHIVPNHLTGRALTQLPLPAAELATLEGRAIIVKRLRPLPIEAVVRGYLIGSGWKDYQRTGTVCGIELPAGLQLAQRLPTPIFTPATKAELGAHDENISFDEVRALIGEPLANQVRTTALALYQFAADFARARGIIIADTKFEFGLTADGPTDIDGRGADTGLLALLARGYLPGGHQPAELRQAVRAGLPRNAGLGQDVRRVPHCPPRSSPAPATSTSKPCSD